MYLITHDTMTPRDKYYKVLFPATSYLMSLPGLDASLKRPGRGQKGGSTSHPKREGVNHTPSVSRFIPVGTRTLLGRKIKVDREGKCRLGWYILDDSAVIKVKNGGVVGNAV
jgi:hypothetical protein